MRCLSPRPVFAALAGLLVAGSAASMELKDPYFGEALFYAHQGQYFEALARLDTELAQHRNVDEPELDTLSRYIDQAEFSVGDFELNYRMHQRAGRAVRAVLEADVPDPVRNEATYRLARIQFHKGQTEDALHALEGMRGEVPEDVRDDVEVLRANVLMALGRPSEAVEVLRRLQGSEDPSGFSTYNLGIALLRDERPREAIRQLDKAGRMSGGQRETLAIRDKANLVLGSMLLDASDFEGAQRSLDRVRLEGPFSNRALLGAGWADASAANFERALVPWSILVERDATDDSVQEAMLALPYAYGKLNVHGRAAMLYDRAVKTFGSELDKLDASIASIRKGDFLKALVREEIRQDKDWVIRLRSLPDTPETFYLVTLMASHDFQSALQNYLDLEDLRKKLAAWKHGLDAFEDITRLRRQYYEPQLPDIDRRFRQLDAQMRLRLEQRKHLQQRLQKTLTAPRPDLLATSSEQALNARLDGMQAALGGSKGEGAEALRVRIQRLRGVLTWGVETEYHRRLTDAHAHLRELAADVEKLTAQYESYVRTRQSAVHSYRGYQTQIEGLRARVADAVARIEVLMARQGHMLETVAINELDARRQRLDAYQNKARFAFADSYDRAVKAQAQAQ